MAVTVAPGRGTWAWPQIALVEQEAEAACECARLERAGSKSEAKDLTRPTLLALASVPDRIAAGGAAAGGNDRIADARIADARTAAGAAGAAGAARDLTMRSRK